jgi:hypothetical protein
VKQCFKYWRAAIGTSIRNAQKALGKKKKDKEPKEDKEKQLKDDKK